MVGMSANAIIANPGGWQARRPAPQVAPTYTPLPQVSAIGPNPNMASLAAAADAERQAIAARAAQRQTAALQGYDQQIARSQQMGDTGYARLANDYSAIAADAAATRDRNMARVDQYGNSARQDLAIYGQQAMAKARQSAIQRGLGNTTIQDSLARGQQFDNQRQQLALEDQLLQNRISTDAQLSGTYQNVLQNRAQGLAGQWNQNIANSNQLASNKLGYLGSIQEDMSGFNAAANLYSQMWQMQNDAEQRDLDRRAQNPAAYRTPTNVVLGRPRTTAWR